MVLLLAAILFTAGSAAQSLRSMDDCFYARKGLEAAESGAFFGVTWYHQPTFQNPSLPFWMLGRSFALFGRNDFAARAPSIVLGLGVLALTWRVAWLLSGSVGVARLAPLLLLICPYFVNHARRCMLDIPFAFWMTSFVWLYLEGLARPTVHLLLAIPLAAAMLTKSALAWLGPVVLAMAAVDPANRPRGPQAGIGITLGIVLGCSWLAHETYAHGAVALRSHLAEILHHTARPGGAVMMVLGYPILLLRYFQPLVLPALWASVALLRAGGWWVRGRGLVLVAWAWGPVLLLWLTTARSDRYVFWVMPALAILVADWVVRRRPRLASVLSSRVVPAIVVLVAGVFWFAPRWLGEDQNRSFKVAGDRIREAIPEGQVVPFLGQLFWHNCNPLLYYSDRLLAHSAASAVEAVGQGRRAGSLLVDRERIEEIRMLAPEARPLVEGPGWVLLHWSPQAGADPVVEPGYPGRTSPAERP